MSATTYMRRYLSCPVVLDNWEVETASIDKYLNHGIKPRADDAWTAKDTLMSELIRETKTNWKAQQFEIEGSVIRTVNIVRVFTGKASPDQVSDALWLAHRYGLITNPEHKRHGSLSLKGYTDKYCGLDCNGFVGNFLGINSDTSIDVYGAPKNRISDVDDIDAGTTLVWYAPTWKKPWAHIAVIDSVQQRGDPMVFTVVQSGGPVQGVHDEVWTKTAKEIHRDSDKHLYLTGFGGQAKVFFCQPLEGGDPNE